MSQKSFLISIALAAILSLGLPQGTSAQDPEAAGSDPQKSSSTAETDDKSDREKAGATA